MYHEITYAELRRRRLVRVVAAIAVVALALAVFFFASFARSGAREQTQLSLRESVLDAAKQCCAVEGSYPSKLSHLEEHYGLVVNHEDYVVNYEWLGDNVMPSVVVRQR